MLQAKENLMKTIQAFLKEYDHIPPEEKCMALLLAEEKFLKIKQAVEEEQMQPEVMKELLLKLMNDLQILKGIQPKQVEQEEQAAKSFTSYENFSMIDDVKVHTNGFYSDNRLLFYFDDDDDEYTVIWRRPKAITLDEPIEEPDNSLSMGDEHLSTILETKLDEVIKSGVENFVPIPSEFEGIFDDTCDVPVCEDPSTFDALNDNSEILSDSNNDGTSSDDDDFEEVEYEEVNDVDQEEKEFDLEDIFQIQDVILYEKLLNVHRLITNIESLKNNPTPDFVLKPPSSIPISLTDSDSFFEESDTSLSHSDNSLPEFETFSDHTEETRSGSTTTHANNSFLEYDSFLFEIEPDQEGLISIDNSNDPLLELPEFESFHFDPSFPRPPPEPPDVEICLHFEPNAPVIDNFNELNDDQRGSEIDFSQNDEEDDSFIFTIRTFLPFVTYPEASPLSCSTGSEDTIFDPGIST
ncbi:hypothetical protein Tco_1295234 [Tanacetum coccineum]